MTEHGKDTGTPAERNPGPLRPADRDDRTRRYRPGPCLAAGPRRR